MSGVILQSQPVPTRSPGVADIVGFTADSVVIWRNTALIKTFNAEFAYNNNGWSVARHVRLVADTTGNKRADLVGFGDEGVHISVNNGNNTWGPPRLVLPNFGYDTNDQWRVEKHIRYMAETWKTGRADVVGFGEDGVLIAYNNGGGNFSSPRLVVSDFGYKSGWRIDRHLRFLADLTGDGTPDIVGFGESQVLVAYNNGNGTFPGSTKAVFGDLTYTIAGDWSVDKHPRMLADLTGDKRADIIGFGDAGVYVALNNGDGTFQPPKIVIKDFCYVNTWRVEKHPRFIADVTGDGRGDIVGFGDPGVYIALNNGDGTFQNSKLVLQDFGYNNGWRVEKHPRFVVDLTGDGAADIVGFGEDGVYVSYNDGNGNFSPSVRLINNTFAITGGWSLDKTVRHVANLF